MGERHGLQHRLDRSHSFVQYLTHGRRETRESGLELGLREKAKAQAKYPRLVAEPDASRHPNSLLCEAFVEAVDGAIVKDRRLQAHATERPGVRPDPFDEGIVPRLQ